MDEVGGRGFGIAKDALLALSVATSPPLARPGRFQAVRSRQEQRLPGLPEASADAS